MTTNLIGRVCNSGVTPLPSRRPGLEPGPRFLSNVAAKAGFRIKSVVTIEARP
ncbi:hypothetical protein FHS97_003476 [Sphingomonas endophytica]|uniref:Uncharacterized protein n=1 Tax=Sphingomonas endophytica TaxID=869719 RepID=A0A7X0JDC9_9SPHN|nr:hypothetical protein [Sphingomonas endophytica]MBB6504697.1 hypothetical protein [Sphingomonas endophytica]